MDAKQKILIIDDEIQIRKILRVSLEASDYKITEASTGNEGVINAATSHPNLIILDLGLPDKDGLTVLKEIREWSNIPIIILSVRNAEEDIIAALNNGADDYLTKPFNTGELIARINAGLRRASQIQESSIFVNDSLSIDLVSHIVSKNKEELKLTVTEYSLLVLFARNISKVLTHRYILKEVWGPSYIDQAQYLRVFVGQLRKKIEDDPSNPKMIITESGVGYRMVQLKQE
jgi:two-component system, OmpR family, KDP operon response regulator KdpE